jgi:hypothetical protein
MYIHVSTHIHRGYSSVGLWYGLTITSVMIMFTFDKRSFSPFNWRSRLMNSTSSAVHVTARSPWSLSPRSLREYRTAQHPTQTSGVNDESCSEP